MIKIDTNLLQELGLDNLSDEQKNDAIEEIMNALKDRVGGRAIDVLNDQQIEALEKQMLEGTFESTQEWLQKNVPDYENMANEELEKIKSEIKSGGLAAIATTPVEDN